MESCYIPNNPQYGLSLEYSAFNTAAGFNATISGFPTDCDPVTDGVLCCSGSLQDCGSCNAGLGSLRDCHLGCGSGINTIHGDLDNCNNGLEECEERLIDCSRGFTECDERLVDCEGRLTNCDNQLLVDCEGRLANNCNERLVNYDGRVSSCDDRLGNCDERLQNCDIRYVDRDERFSDRLVDCGKQLENCDGRFVDCHGNLTNCDDPSNECGGRLGECEDNLVDCDDNFRNSEDRLINLEERLTNCDDGLVDCSGRLSNCDERITGCDSRLGTYENHLSGCDDRPTEGQLATNDDHLIECDGRLTNCDVRLRHRDERLIDCDGRLTGCDERLIDNDRGLTHRDDRLIECDDRLPNCDNQLVDCDERLTHRHDRLANCDERLEDCGGRLTDCEGSLECSVALGGGAGSVGPTNGCWAPDDMGSFSLPPLDLDPLPSLFPFSPCSGNYKGEFKEKQPHEVADVLLSLKHAVVHPGAELGSSYSQQDLSLHPQMVMGGAGCYDPCGPSVFPTMSVNVSMNMTMHGYPPDQMCPQMQWGQNPSTSPMNVMYSQNQGVMSPTPYPGSATYSFTADFRTPNQSDPLITATSSFKPIQITNQKPQQNLQNYNIFSQKSVQPNYGPLNPSLGQKPPPLNFGSCNSNQMKTRSAAKLQLSGEHHHLGGNVMGPTYQILGGQGQNHMNAHSLGYPSLGSGIGNLQSGISMGDGKVQVGSLSGCSGSDDEQKPNLCRICGKTYARPSTLKTHLRTHSGERPYRCSDCNKSFSQAANLTAHVRTHTGQKPFRCPICDRRFSQSSSVTTHMRTHSGERPYRCRACKKAFSDSSTLTKHLRIHSGEKPYQCKLCLLRFSQSGNLNRHMRVHGNNAAMLG